MQIQVVKLRSLVQMLREFRLCGQYLESTRDETSWTWGRHMFTMLFEKRGSSGLADRLSAENARMISANDASGAFNAKSTRL